MEIKEVNLIMDVSRKGVKKGYSHNSKAIISNEYKGGKCLINDESLRLLLYRIENVFS